jgi:hypothetical protein
MSPTDVRDLMARALPDQPVRITRESALAAGRLAQRRRRQTQVAIAVAAFCAVVLAAVVPFGLGRPGAHAALGSSSSPRSSSPPPSAPASPSPAPSPSAPPSARPGDLASMSVALLSEAQRLLPTARFDPVAAGGFPDGNPIRAPFALADNGHGYDVAFAQILVPPSTVGTFVLSIWPRSDGRKAPNPGCDNAYQPVLSCETRTGPAGERITIETGNYQGTSTIEHKVKVFRTDGTILSATLSDAAIDPTIYFSQGPASPGSTPQPTSLPMTNSAPPMTPDQMLTLLSIPGLTLAK